MAGIIRWMMLKKRLSNFWWITVAAVLAAGVTVSLGLWQMRRAAAKDALQTAILERQALPTLSPRDLPVQEPVDVVVHRRMRVQGQWLPQATVFLENRPMAGRTGFYVLTPLRLAADGRVLVVQRGWVPRDFMDRTKLPEVPTPAGLVEVEGRLTASPSRVYEMGGAGEGRIRQNLDLAELSRALSADVLTVALLQTEEASGTGADGLLRQWPQVAVDVHKHHGYAFQWFGLSALIVVLYVWFQFILPRRRRRLPSE
jgi:surfeit locus 1 family protein